jgi:hypothetical protein
MTPAARTQHEQIERKKFVCYVLHGDVCENTVTESSDSSNRSKSADDEVMNDSEWVEENLTKNRTRRSHTPTRSSAEQNYRPSKTKNTLCYMSSNLNLV